MKATSNDREKGRCILYEIFGLRYIVCFKDEKEANKWIDEMKSAAEEAGEEFKVICTA